MKYLRSLGIHVMLWSGIYWGVVQGNSAVANLTGVAVFLIAMLTVIVSMVCHWIAETKYELLAEALDNASLGRLGDFAARASTLGVAGVLITQGNGWLILGTVWLLSAFVLLSLKARVKFMVDNAVR